MAVDIEQLRCIAMDAEKPGGYVAFTEMATPKTVLTLLNIISLLEAKNESLVHELRRIADPRPESDYGDPRILAQDALERLG